MPHAPLSSPSDVSDVVVIGAGLAGLAAAVTVGRSGRSVTVLERLPRLGGLCGTFEEDGHVYVRACNEFGGGVQDTLEALGVQVEFRRSWARLFLPEGAIHMPPLPVDAATFVRHAPGLTRFLRQSVWHRSGVLTDALDVPGMDPWVRSLFAFVASASATPAERLRIADLAEFPRAGFGWHRPVKAIGGPDAVVAALAGRVRALGGVIHAEADVTDVTRDDAGFRVVAGDRVFRGRRVITSAPRWEVFPKESKHGLWYGTALIRLLRDVDFPGKATTVHYVPKDGLLRLGDTARGTLPDDFGFLLTRQLDSAPASGRTLVSFFAVPTELWEFDDAHRVRIEAHIRRVGQTMLPGLSRETIGGFTVVSPQRFFARHGILPRPMALSLPVGADKPLEYDSDTGLYHVGASVGPVGADGAAAVLSGKRVAERVVGSFAI